MKAFDKPALSTAEQVDLLLSRGMQVVQPQRAAKVLQHINYYRLRAYWLAFEVHSQTERNHRFADGTDFDLVVAIYNFDRELRLLVLDAVERFEISLRTRLSNELTLRYGPFAHEDGSRFTRQAVWQTGLDELRREYNRSRETFAEHYRTEYPQLTTPPLWVVSKLMSIGHLSRWVQNIASPKDRQAIANANANAERNRLAFHIDKTSCRDLLESRLPDKETDTGHNITATMLQNLLLDRWLLSIGGQIKHVQKVPEGHVRYQKPIFAGFVS